MFPKTEIIRLAGPKLHDLNDLIYERDGGCCVLCGKAVPYGSKFHHIIFRSHSGSDVEQNGVTLCLDCHKKAHGVKAKSIKNQLQEYIRRYYGNCFNG